MRRHGRCGAPGAAAPGQAPRCGPTRKARGSRGAGAAVSSSNVRCGERLSELLGFAGAERCGLCMAIAQANARSCPASHALHAQTGTGQRRAKPEGSTRAQPMHESRPTSPCSYHRGTRPSPERHHHRGWHHRGWPACGVARAPAAAHACLAARVHQLPSFSQKLDLLAQPTHSNCSAGPACCARSRG